MMELRLRVWKLFEDNSRTKAGRYCRAGWSGFCLYDLSPYERDVVNSFFEIIPENVKWVTRDTSEDSCGFADEYVVCCSYTAWLGEEEHVAAFTDMVRNIPDRVHVFEVSEMPSPEHLALLDGLNFMVYRFRNDQKGSGRLIISIQECPEASLIKLIYG